MKARSWRTYFQFLAGSTALYGHSTHHTGDGPRRSIPNANPTQPPALSPLHLVNNMDMVMETI